MKVLVCDNLDKVGVDILNKAGLKTELANGLKPEQLQKIIGKYDGLVIRSATNVNKELLKAASRLKVVGRAGVGLDNVDIPTRTQKGVVVMNTPGGNTITTAEHTIAMIMALCRKIPSASASVKSGKWEKKRFMGAELFGKTCGVIGFGNIGSNVATRLKALKMKVIVYEPNMTSQVIEKAGFRSVALDELFAISDILTLHTPKVAATTNLFCKSNFSKMKKGVYIINCARGGIVNEADLAEAIEQGKVAGAALDVFEKEPPQNSPLLELDEVILTPHLGASTAEAQENVAVQVAKQIVSFLQDNTIINAVNAPSITGELLMQFLPFINLADRLGSLLHQLTLSAIRGVEIQFVGSFPDEDKTPITCAFLQGLLAPSVREQVNSINAKHIAKKMGISISETQKAESSTYTNLINISLKTQESAHKVSGTIFGKNDPRIVRLDNFRLEVVPKGHLLLIQNDDSPGAIGSIGNLLGKLSYNIEQMTVGQDDNGEKTIVFIITDKKLSPETLLQLKKLPKVIAAKSLEL